MVAMGIGRLGAPNIIIKRKFRFTLQFTTPCGPVPEHYVKLAARPQLDVEETELNFLNAVTWIPGKGRWQPLNVTYVDVASSEMQGLYNWVATVYEFGGQQANVTLRQSEKEGWNGTGLLTMYDGCGSPLEYWVLNSCWPQSINFGDLDYSDSETATIELTIRFSDVQFFGTCGVQTPVSCCRGC